MKAVLRPYDCVCWQPCGTNPPESCVVTLITANDLSRLLSRDQAKECKEQAFQVFRQASAYSVPSWPSECRSSSKDYTNTVCTSQETHYVSATEPNRLMLFGETVAVYCENHTEHTNTLCGHFSTYLTGNALCLRCRAQPVNAVWGNSRCLL
jgi:hypothetical protein